jgi:hypothetical protein
MEPEIDQIAEPGGAGALVAELKRLMEKEDVEKLKRLQLQMYVPAVQSLSYWVSKHAKQLTLPAWLIERVLQKSATALIASI